MSSSGLDFFDVVRNTIHLGVHEQNYKGGAFKDKIFKETDAVDSLDTLISSAETTPAEKAIINAVRKMCEDYRKHGLKYPDVEDFLNTPDEYFVLGELFAEDAKARGA
jgi:hypothetical protein